MKASRKKKFQVNFELWFFLPTEGQIVSLYTSPTRLITLPSKTILWRIDIQSKPFFCSNKLPIYAICFSSISLNTQIVIHTFGGLKYLYGCYGYFHTCLRMKLNMIFFWLLYFFNTIVQIIVACSRKKNRIVCYLKKYFWASRKSFSKVRLKRFYIPMKFNSCLYSNIWHFNSPLTVYSFVITTTLTQF